MLENYSFQMTIENVFAITGRGTVVVGCIERGIIKPNDKVDIVGNNKEPMRDVIVSGVETHHKLLDSATVGDNVCILLKGVARSDVEVGNILVIKNESNDNPAKVSALSEIMLKQIIGR